MLENSIDTGADLKIKYKDDFEHALIAYFKKDFTTALKLLKFIHKNNPADEAVKIYLNNTKFFRKKKNISDFELVEKILKK